jgi:hypothetical protein
VPSRLTSVFPLLLHQQDLPEVTSMQENTLTRNDVGGRY